MKKRIYLSLISCILTLLLLTTLSFGTELATNTAQRVYDFAQLFTSSEVSQLEQGIKTLQESYKADIVIVTEDNTQGKTSRAYADDFYDDNGFGYGSSRDGLLLLIDMDNREIYISTCGQAIPIFTDNRIEEMLDSIVSYMADGDYYKAAYNFLVECDNYLSKGIPQSNTSANQQNYPQYYPVENQETLREQITPVVAIFVSFIFALAITLITRFSITHKYKKPSKHLPPLIPQNVRFTERRDSFVTSHTTRVHVPRNTNNNNGSGMGGSSTHMGSSGTSHGGGGRGF